MVVGVSCTGLSDSEHGNELSLTTGYDNGRRISVISQGSDFHYGFRGHKVMDSQTRGMAGMLLEPRHAEMSFSSPLRLLLSATGH